MFRSFRSDRRGASQTDPGEPVGQLRDHLAGRSSSWMDDPCTVIHRSYRPQVLHHLARPRSGGSIDILNADGGKKGRRRTGENNRKWLEREQIDSFLFFLYWNLTAAWTGRLIFQKCHPSPRNPIHIVSLSPSRSWLFLFVLFHLHFPFF